MALDPACVGRSYPPSAPYYVSREKIREFADAIGDPHPAYRDPAAAAKFGYPDVVAPPTFPIAVCMQAGLILIDDPELGLDHSRVVHGDQRFSYVRPVFAGDRLVCATTIEEIRNAGGMGFLTTRTDLTTEAGEPVVAVRVMLVVRGE